MRAPFGWEPARHPPAQTRLFISADSRYKLWLNGQFLSRGPARSWPHAQQVDVLDVTDRLLPEGNAIAVQVYQPGYSHFSYVHRGAAGLLAWLDWDGQPVLWTDTAWQVRRNSSYSARVERVSIYGSGVENRTLAKADGWQQPDYSPGDTDSTTNNTTDAWASARVVAEADGPIWRGLQTRGVPLLQEQLHPLSVAAVEGPVYRQGATPTGLSDPHEILRAGWPTARSAELIPDANGWFQPRLGQGETGYWLFDLGRGYTCAGEAEIHGADEGQTLLVSYADKRKDGALVLSDPSTYCRVRLTDRFRLGQGDQTAAGFSLRGGRFLLFALQGPTPDGFRIRLRARLAQYPLKIDRPLTVEDPLLARISQMCEATVRACLQETFVDAAWRESSQWLGDALMQGLALTSMSRDYRPLRTALEMAAQGAYPDGILPSILPGEVHAYCVLDYNFSWVELLLHYYTLTTDYKFVDEMWPTLKRMFRRFAQDVGSDGLLRSQPGRRLFLDWSPVSRQEPNAIYNLRYLYALQQAIALAERWRGVPVGEVEELWQHSKRVQNAIYKTFWRDGRWYDDPERTTFSQQAAALALLTDTVNPVDAEFICYDIYVRSMDLQDEHTPGQMVLASPFMHHYIFEAFWKHQQEQYTLEIIRQRWGRWVEQGFPTTWENWNLDFPDGSQCHAFSAHPRYHLARIVRARRTSDE